MSNLAGPGAVAEFFYSHAGKSKGTDSKEGDRARDTTSKCL